MIAPLLLSHLVQFLPASLAPQLLGHDLAFNRITTDSRQLEQGDLFIALRGDHFDGHDYVTAAIKKGAIAVVVEHADASLSIPHLIVTDTTQALGQIAALNRAAFQGPLLAITGSSGKTTVKTMIATILRECGSVLMTQGNFNNHIGVPLTLLQIDASHQYAVIELGASAPGEIAYLCSLAKPNVVGINNVMPAHVQGFGSLRGISQAKSEIYQGMTADGTAIVNLDDAFASDWLALLGTKKIITVSLLNEAANCFARDIQLGVASVKFTLVINKQVIAVTLNALGEHSVRNALMAAASAFSVGADIHKIQQGLAQFAPVAGRMSRHHTSSGALIIDDSYNANPGSVRAAIDVLVGQGQDTILVLGDMAELGEYAADLHADIGRYARTQGIRKIFTQGPLSQYASATFGEGAQHFKYQAALVEALQACITPSTKILIKGSRSAKTDVIVRALCDELSNTVGDHQ